MRGVWSNHAAVTYLVTVRAGGERPRSVSDLRSTCATLLIGHSGRSTAGAIDDAFVQVLVP